MLATARRLIELVEFVKAGHWKHSIDETLYGVDRTPKYLAFSGWVGSVPPSLVVRDSASICPIDAYT
jgi:hypothetical protein